MTDIYEKLENLNAIVRVGEAEKVIKRHYTSGVSDRDLRFNDGLDVAISALKFEVPYENAKDFANDVLNELSKFSFVEATAKEEQRTFRDDADKIDAYFGRHEFVCKRCGAKADYFVGGEGSWWCSHRPNFCPMCGKPSVVATDE